MENKQIILNNCNYIIPKYNSKTESTLVFINFFISYFYSQFYLFNNYFCTLKNHQHYAIVTSQSNILDNPINLLISTTFSNIFLMSFLKFNSKFSKVRPGWYLENYMRLISYEYLGFYTNWCFIDLCNPSTNPKHMLIFRKIVKSRRFKFLQLKNKQFYNIFLQLTYLKDTQLLIELFQQHLRKAEITRHKSYFYKIRDFLTLWFHLCSKKDIVKGYSLYFKGKLGKKGSVRKKKIFFKAGRISFTNKNLCVSYRSYSMGTISGVVGANIAIFY